MFDLEKGEMVEDDNMKNKRTATIGALLCWFSRACHDERK